ncbi:splicing factor 45-like [Gigantopelta aegis]|uniref:splicing factor 45-like n=1 Tax=Gigantopelta aegis TaxID=1735272 RepID=UPI001B889781|nr:splicing factor 45-like [Gigantopelta aegis]XP_041350439.1 splicing factor 45-like [Gigantopelta aegis]
MSLYDDIDEGGSGTKRVVPGWSSGYKLLQSHVQAKKASLLQTKKPRSGATTLAPVIDLKRSEGVEMHFNTLTGKLEGVSPTTVTGSPFVPSPVIPSITGVVDEYDPFRPNEYDDLVKKKKEQKQRDREEDRKRDEELRNARRKDRDRDRMMRDDDTEKEFDRARRHRDETEEEEYIDRPRAGGGAAIAPPKSLIEDDIPPPEESEGGSERPSSPPSFGYSIGVGGSVASRIMAKYGYKEGQGLGKKEQGMSTALYVEKTSKRGGKIIHEKDMAKEIPKEPVTNTNLIKNPSKVILLRNMVGPGEVDDELEPETAEECSKYGTVIKVLIFEIPAQTDDEAVRIFIEFERVESAIKAIVDLNGRFFGGRIVKGTFYNLDKFRRLDLGDSVD